ncbi:MAG: hypothetical protein AAFM92_08920 [Pseudomonadota bacterium]
MLANISIRLSNARVSRAVDWAVLSVGALMLAVAIVGSVVSGPATSADTAQAERPGVTRSAL